jgi:NADH dehydrogenase (ubiquinone) 1 alpha subcomplex subunit 9
VITPPSKQEGIWWNVANGLTSLYRNFDYADVHVKGASRIAEISAANGVSRFVHVSHLNASYDSPSEFYRTKAQGEDAVRQAFPDATIVRPSPLYGHEDKLLNSMACKSPNATRIVD